jgi:hypothetical protein
MVQAAENRGGGSGNRWRMVGWGLAAALLALPAVAMRFTSEVVWTASDFVVMGVLFALVGGGLELVVRLSTNWASRAGAAVAILTAFLTIWVNLAVGMIGSEDNPYNLVFLGVLAFALLGAMVARFRPAGTARAMALTATAQLVAAALGLSADVRGAIFSAVFALLWLFSAGLFRKAADDQKRPAAI